MRSLKTPIGWLRITEQDGRLVDINFISKKPPQRDKPTPLEKKAEEQIAQYFQGKGKKFILALNLVGTEFQQRVWQALQNIPYGEVKTYGQLAKELNSSARAVGNACRANPVPIIVPCHRIVAANGIGGFAGKTEGPIVERKRWLLAHESSYL